MEKTMSRRAALGALASTAAIVVPFVPPVANAVEHQGAEPPAISIEELAEQFRDAAMKLDPRITECWLGYDELADGPRDMRVMHVYFGRKDTPFLRPATAPVKPADTIADLFAEWREVNGNPAGGETKEHFDSRRYVALQRRITSMRPRSVREAAMQFVVETDDGDSDFRQAFYRRVRKLALEG